MDFGAKMVCVLVKMATFVGVNTLIMDRSIYLVLANGFEIGQEFEQRERVYVDSITLDLKPPRSGAKRSLMESTLAQSYPIIFMRMETNIAGKTLMS